MPESQLEKHIKNKVDGRISPIDADALWTDIQKKQRKPIPYWSISGALLVLFLLAGGLAFYLIGNTSDQQNFNVNKPTFENNESSSIEISENNSLQTEDNDEKINHLTTNNKNKNKEQKIRKVEIDTNKITANTNDKDQLIEPLLAKTNVSNISLNNETNILQKTNLEKKATLKKPKIRQPKNDLNQNKITSFNTPENKDIQVLEQDQIKGEISKVTKPSIQLKTDNEPSINLKKNFIRSKKMNKPVSKKENLKITSENIQESHKNPTILKVIQLLKMRTMALENNTKQLSISKSNLTQMPVIQNKPRFELGAYATYEYAFRQFTKANITDSIFNFNDSLVQSYIKTRNDTETFVESFRTGVFLHKTFKPGFRITAGVEYAQLTERFDAELNLGRFTLFDDLDSSKYKIVERTHLKKIYNRYKTLNAPILIGKKFNTQKWSFWFDAGVGFNLKFDYSGQIFQDSTGEKVIHFTNNEQSVFKEKLGLSYIADFGFAYTFNEGYSIEFGTHFQSTFNTINQNYGLDTKYYFAGFKASLIKQF